MSNTPAPSPAPTRSCGGCTLCCKALAITELNKPTGVACPHICSSGCAVQDQRSASEIYSGCNTYNCLWLLGGLEEKDRPDKLKAVFTALPHPNPQVKIPIIMVNEAFAGSSDSGRARELINGFLRQGYSIAVKNSQYSTEYFPDGRTIRYRIDRRDPLRIKYDPEAKPISLTVGGRPV